MTNEARNLEFISLKDFLELPFINPYNKCIVDDFDSDDVLIREIQIKDLIIELEDGMYEELQEEYYVSDLMPSVGCGDDRIFYGRYHIYLKRY